MKLFYSVSPEQYRRMGTRELRKTFLFDNLFQNDRINLAYWETDRTIYGGAMPSTQSLLLGNYPHLASEFFCQRRELGVFNIGGPGKVTVDGTVHSLNKKDCLYVGRGSRGILFSSEQSQNPAKFLLASYPAHAVFPTVSIPRPAANRLELGSQETANRRVIYQYIHETGAKSCQLVMGFAQLEPGSVWKTMPAHTHTRRSEVYCYFEVPEEAAVFHFMGGKEEPRHLVMQNEEVVFSPIWSIHSGCGTSAYSFCWCMGGENQCFKDMDAIKISELKLHGCFALRHRETESVRGHQPPQADFSRCLSPHRALGPRRSLRAETGRPGLDRFRKAQAVKDKPQMKIKLTGGKPSLASLSLLVGLFFGAAAGGETPALADPVSPIRHRFICVDNSGPSARLIHVDQTRPDAGWIVPLPNEGPRDLQLVGSGKVLVSLSRGYGEYDINTGKELRKISGFKDISTARRLDNGHTLLAGTESNCIVVYETDTAGKPCATPRRIPGEGRPLRQMRVLPNGNLLLHVSKDQVAEVDSTGKCVWSVTLPGDIPGTKGTLAERLWDGSTLVGLGNGVKVAQYDAHGRLLRFWGEDRKGDHPQWRLDYTSGFDFLPNGHVVMCNWQGHLADRTGPHLVEFDDANRLVWQWGDRQLARQVTHVLMLDAYALSLNADQDRAYALALEGLRRYDRPLEPVSKTIRPFSVAEGFAIQDRLTPDLAAIWGPVSGYKLAYVSKASQIKNGIDEPVYGPLFRSQAVRTGGTIHLNDFQQLYIEAEVVFVIGQRIDRPIASVERLRQHVRSVCVGLEVPDGGRLKSIPGHKGNVADVLAAVCCCRRYVMGPPVDPNSIELPSLTLRMRHNGKQVYEGSARGIMDDPWNGLLWAVERMTREGKALEPSDVVFSGAVAAVYTATGAAAEGGYEADGGPLGKVSVQVVASPSKSFESAESGGGASEVAAVSGVIAKAFNNRVSLQPAFTPLAVEDAYRVQDRLAETMARLWGPVAGYKVAFVRPDEREVWPGMSDPINARLFAGQQIPCGGTLALHDYLRPEAFMSKLCVAFTLGERIAAPVADLAELKTKVRSVHPALEMPEFRFPVDGKARAFTDFIAFNGVSHRWTLGPGVAPGAVNLAGLNLSMKINGKMLYEGSADRIMGDPWNALFWMVNHAARRGIPLEAGQVVMAGSVGIVANRSAPELIGDHCGECGALGQVRLQVVP